MDPVAQSNRRAWEAASKKYVREHEDLLARPGHEIVLVYEADLADDALYRSERLRVQEDDGSALDIIWKSQSSFRVGEAPLYPDGLLDLLS